MSYAYAILKSEVSIGSINALSQYERVSYNTTSAQSARPASGGEALEESLAVARQFHHAIERGEINGVGEMRVVLEYLGLRARLGHSFDGFPCLDFMLRLHERIEAGGSLSPREVQSVLNAAANYQRVNPRATPAALQACYALDVALTRLSNVVGNVAIIEGVHAALRARGCLTQRQIDGVCAWFDRRGMPFPNARAIRE